LTCNRAASQFFLLIFVVATKAKERPRPLYPYMRQLRQLAQGVWYEVRSGINNREPILSQARAVALFDRVFR
jgi:hypothetical protein